MQEIDVNAQHKFFQRALPTFKDCDFLYREVQSRLSRRLHGMKFAHEGALDLALPQTQEYGSAMLRDGFKLKTDVITPLEYDQLTVSNYYDLVYSNFSLSLSDIMSLFPKVLNALKPNGLFVFSMLGPASFRELRQAFQFDSYPHVARFYDMHTVGDLLLSTGFTDPVMESYPLTVNYNSFDSLLRDMRGMGLQFSSSERRCGLLGKHFWRSVQDQYPLNDKKQYPLTVEVTLGHGWKSARPVQINSGNEVTVSADHIQRRQHEKD